jgi:hypothetical protein
VLLLAAVLIILGLRRQLKARGDKSPLHAGDVRQSESDDSVSENVELS